MYWVNFEAAYLGQYLMVFREVERECRETAELPIVIVSEFLYLRVFKMAEYENQIVYPI